MSYVRQGPMTFSRASTATYIGRDGLVKRAAVNEPRVEFDPATGLSLGFLVEDSATNLCNNSTYNATRWTSPFPLYGSISTGLDAPDGSLTAARFTSTASGSNNSILRVSITPFTPNGTDVYTISFWARLVSNLPAFVFCDLSDDTSVSGNYASKLVANKWVRISYSGTPTATSKSFLDLSSNNNTAFTIDFWGVQIEKGSEATSYIPTTGTPATRATDVATFSTQESILPPNATPQEQATSGAIGRISDVPVPIRSLWNPDTCPASLLPWLAWGLSVDDWNADWTEAQKRNVIRSSVETHRQKGTIGAVRRVADSFGLGIVLREWWQKSPQGTPHTFTLSISIDQIPTGARESILNAIRKVKPVRSDFNLDYQTGYLAGINAAPYGKITLFDRFQASLN